MVFGDALELMKAGWKMRRASFAQTDNEKIAYVDYTIEQNPYLVFDSQNDTHKPCHPDDNDLFSDDWEIADDG